MSIFQAVPTLPGQQQGRSVRALTVLLGNAQFQLVTPSGANNPQLETLVGFFSANLSPFPLYVQVFNAAAAVVDTTPAIISIPLGSLNQSFSYEVLRSFGTGIRLAVSTTPATLTTADVADVLNFESVVLL